MTRQRRVARIHSSAAGLTSRTRIEDNHNLSLQEPPVMITPRNSVFLFVAACSLAMAACQPAEGPAERAGKSVDNAAKKVGDQVDKAADKVKDAVN
jgi:hypothetical protein